jgi:hypothetical protein
MNTARNLKHSSPIPPCEEALSSRSLQATSTSEHDLERPFHCLPEADKASTFKPLLEQTQTIAIEPEQLHHVSAPSAKDEDVARVGLLLKRRLHLCRKALKTASHVRHARRNPDTGRGAPLLQEEVRHERRLASTARTMAGSA